MKAIFLDRDGVLNKLINRSGKLQAPYTLLEFELFSGVEEALRIIKFKGYLAVVVTNQPDVKRAWVSRESVELINNEILKRLPIDDIKICYHINEDQCSCRKPAPGMLIDAAKKWGIDLNLSYMVGDRYSDIAAGHVIGCQTILIGDVDSGNQGSFPSPDFRANSLIEAMKFI